LITLEQLAGSTEPIQFAIAAIDAEGNSYDPSADSCAVAFAAVTSPPTAFDPSTATWYTAAMETQPGNPVPVYWVTILVGPLNGGVVLAAGSYTCYVRVTDNPAVPVKRGAWLNLT
jgi:hypothetical protein